VGELNQENRRQNKMVIAKVQFNSRGSVFSFNPKGIRLRQGDTVFVSTRRGREIARVLSILSIGERRRLRPIMKRVEEKDLEIHRSLLEKERAGTEFCKERIRENRLNMSLVKVNFLLDGSRAVFYYTASERVDFRQLVKELAKKFHTRIQMHQIGSRDKSKVIGGIGVCGRELCCASYMTKFVPVTVKMARDQNISVNPTRITGQCGRLKCCLSYELKTYREARRGLPNIGAMVLYERAECKVLSVDILARALLLELSDGNYKRVSIDEVKKLSEGNESELVTLSMEEKKALETLDDPSMDESKLDSDQTSDEEDTPDPQND
jgi:cell fate regulator YaaT (PSP1 superfamily)